MAHLLPGAPGPDSDEDRRHALAGIAVLAGMATLAVVLLIVIISVVRGAHHGRNAAITIAPTQSASSAGSAAPRTSGVPSQSTPPQTSSRTTLHTRPPATGNPCPSTAACVVNGDSGGAVAALNGFRVSRGLPAVPGSTSSQAQQCALDQGESPACAPHYAWQIVPKQDGTQVIGLIAGRDAQWLLDPGMTSFSVGWAYVPSTRLYECAILKIT